MDWERLLSSARIGGTTKTSYIDKKYSRSEFEKDYRRIVSSASFRRLQDKTQVFPLDKSDFVRTRLTHSIETASFAKELGDMAVKEIKDKYYDAEEEMPESINNIPDILMCAGLLHDIGNPPFGHFGEVVIGDWFRESISAYKFCGQKLSALFNEQMIEDLCNFEGNAQALRLLAKLHFLDNDHGMNLTDAVLNTLVKYPNISTQIDPEHDNIIYHKMGYFFGDTNVFNEIATRTGTYDNVQGQYRHPLTFLLEAADDIAYSTADLEDGFKKGMFSLKQFLDFIYGRYDYYDKQGKLNSYQSQYTRQLFDRLSELWENPKLENSIQKDVSNLDLYAIQNWIIYVQGWLTYCAFYGFKENYDEIMDGTYKHELLYGTNHEYSLRILKEAMREFIFPAKSIVKLELAAKTILTSLLEKFVPAILYYDYIAPKDVSPEEKNKYKQSKADEKLTGLFSENYIENYKLEVQYITDESEKLYYRLLLVTDFISGMTDSYAKALYQELNGIY